MIGIKFRCQSEKILIIQGWTLLLFVLYLLLLLFLRGNFENTVIYPCLRNSGVGYIDFTCFVEYPILGIHLRQIFGGEIDHELTLLCFLLRLPLLDCLFSLTG
ncbi:hypothetical protein [Acetonema longum]|uniref:hypothetical protein n=1 Tax=Acetonema longum TaxID=2374 RepID=UPI00145E7F2B|nr:hypothetical protein [Acetonema longum]